MLWHALPPELNTARLMVGAGPTPMLQAASGWTGLATALEAQADELAMQLTALTAAWTGDAGEQAVAAATPMVGWLRSVSAQAQRRAEQASAQAAAYTKAMAMTPSLPEIATNHVTRAVLVSTNFLGINTVPIGAKEADYFVRMWNQAAGAMDAYQAETAVNTTFEPTAPRKPILMPGVGEAVKGQTMGLTAQMAAQPSVSDVIADVTARAANPAMMGVAAADAPSRLSEAATAFPQLMNFMQQTGQMGSPLFQQLSSLMQQSGGAPGLGNLGDVGRPQMGLLGAGPMSNHPLAGGAGPGKGGGLLRAGDLPGAGGEPTRTPLLANMIDKYGPTLAPAATTAVNAGAGAGAAPGTGSGVGGSGMGGAPMGMAGAHSAAAAASRTGLVVPALLADDSGESDDRRDDDPYEDW